MTRPTLYPTGKLLQKTLMIPAELWAEMEAEARARKVSVGTVARERLSRPAKADDTDRKP